MFIIEKNIFISNPDRTVLNLLYGPILSPNGIALYNALNDYHLFSHHNQYFYYDDLVKTLQISLVDIDLLQRKLEAIGLIKTFRNKDKKDKCIISINKPLAPENFKDNKFIFNQFLKKSDILIFERVLSLFKTTSYDKKDFEDVTSKFQDQFDMTINNNEQNTLELSLNFKNMNMDDAIVSLPPLQYYNYLSNDVAPPTIIKIVSAQQQQGFSNRVINKIMCYSHNVNGRVVGNHISKIGMDFYFKGITTFDEVAKDLNRALKNKGLESKTTIEVAETKKEENSFEKDDWKANLAEL